MSFHRLSTLTFAPPKSGSTCVLLIGFNMFQEQNLPGASEGLVSTTCVRSTRSCADLRPSKMTSKPMLSFKGFKGKVCQGPYQHPCPRIPFQYPLPAHSSRQNYVFSRFEEQSQPGEPNDIGLVNAQTFPPARPSNPFFILFSKVPRRKTARNLLT